MKIAHLRISNILGIENFELSPGGTLTEIAGDNGLGKTSILEAIKAATQGGHDATLLRKGAEKGEIVLVLDDGTQLHKQVSAGKSSLDLFDAAGKKVPRPSDAIKGLTDLMSVNPVDFLTAPKKDRVQVLLEAMPIAVDAERLSKISNMPLTAQKGMSGLAVLEHIRLQVYEDRTGTNRAVLEKEATINQLTLAMPEVPGGAEGDEDQLIADLDAARTTRDTETKRIDDKLTGLRTISNNAVQALKDAAQVKIDEIRAQLTVDVDAEKASLADTEGKAGKQREKAIATFTAVEGPINITLSAIRANRNAAAKREQTRQTIELMEKDLGDLRGDAAKQTSAIAAIDEYKSELLDALPIPGLAVLNGDVLRHGIPFDRLNTAQQVDIAIEIAKLRSGELAVCCVDRFECLSPETFTEFKSRAEQSGLQLFVTRVEPGELTIRTS